MFYFKGQYVTIYFSLWEALKAPMKVVKLSEFVTYSQTVTEDTPANQNIVRQELQIRRYLSIFVKNSLLKETFFIKKNMAYIPERLNPHIIYIYNKY